MLLVGDVAYYGRVGFKPVPKGRATMPGPVDYSRLLVAELVDGAFLPAFAQEEHDQAHRQNGRGQEP